MKRRFIILLAACLALLPAGAGAPTGAAVPAGTTAAAGKAAPAAFALLSRSLIEGPARAAVFFGDRAILGTGGGIVIVGPGERAVDAVFLPIEGKPYDIAVRGNAAYIAAMSGGLVAIDISDPRHPAPIYQMRTPQAQSCAVAAGCVFAADFRSRLYIFDIATSPKPVFKDMRKLPFVPVCVRADKDILAIAYQTKAELHRVFPDGSTELLSTIEPEAGIRKAVLGGGILCIATDRNDVRCWNVSDPKNPSPLSPVAAQGVVDIALDGAGGDSGFLLTSGRTIVPFELSRGTTMLGGSSVKVRLAKPFSLSAIPVATPLRNSPENSPGPPPNDRFRNPPEFSVALSGRHFLTLSPFEGLRFYERSREGPKLIGRIPTRGFAVDCIAADSLVYVANNYDGVRIGRLGAGGAVAWIGHAQTSEARDLALDGSILFVADGIGGLRAIDVARPSAPRIVGNLASQAHSSAIAIRGGKAYIAGGMQGVEIVDISNPRKLQRIWRKSFSEVRGIETDGRFLYFPDGGNGLKIYSLEKGSPSFMSSLDTPGWNCGIFLAKGTAYLADGQSGVEIVDVRDPAAPKAVGSLSLGVLTRQVHLRGATLFAAAHTAGIAAIDVSKPASPIVAARFETVDDGRGVFADERFVLLASGEGGLYIFRYPR